MTAKRFLDEFQGRAKQLGEHVQLAAQIACLVGHVDDVLADEPLRGIGEGKNELVGEMIA